MNKSLEILNNLQMYRREKVRTLEGLKLSRYSSPIEFNRYSATCLVYTVWGNRNYLKWLYLSLKTLKYFTDLNMINIRIITDEYLGSLCKGMFEDILPDECFIIKPFPLSLKYNISNLPEFQDFENIIIWDVDAFVYNFDGIRYNLFKELVRNINKSTIILGYKVGEFERMFENMNKVLNKTNPYDWYRDECDINNIEDIDSYYDRWTNSSFTMYKRKSMKTKEYRNLCSSLLSHQHLCDETVYHVYGFLTDIKINELSDYNINLVDTSDFDDWYMEKPEGFYWTHPVLGDEINLKYIKKFYREIDGL